MMDELNALNAPKKVVPSSSASQTVLSKGEPLADRAIPRFLQRQPDSAFAGGGCKQ